MRYGAGTIANGWCMEGGGKAEGGRGKGRRIEEERQKEGEKEVVVYQMNKEERERGEKGGGK